MHYQVVRWSLVLQLALLLSSCSGREQRSLLNTFPFNSAAVELPAAPAGRQGADPAALVDFAAVAEASAAGKRCIDKIVMEEETEYEEVYECNHSYNRRCTTSYTTTYTAQQEEECEENYKKNCFIQYSPTAYQATVQICREPLVKDCNAEGPITCSTEYQSECETIQHEHQVEDDVVDCSNEIQTKCEDVTSGYSTSQECSNWPVQKCSVQKKTVSKYSPETSCRKVAVELCGPSSCPVVPGPKECYETTKTIASEKPEEECNLEPSQACKHVTRLVPELRPAESCLDVPKEVCTRSQTNPRKVAKPVVKKWCYTPTAESGLEEEPASDSNRLPNFVDDTPQCPQFCANKKGSGGAAAGCDPRCNEFAAICGIPVCTPTTTTTTTTTPRPPPPIEAVVCPSSCRPGYQTNGRCEPQCDVAECDFDPDCDEPPSYVAPVTTTTTKPTTTTTTTTTTTRTTTTTTTTTPPACPVSCRPGFQNNGRCEVQCHTPACGYDPDCNAPIKKPEVGYLPPAPDAGGCGPSQRGCRSSATDTLVFSLPEANRSSGRGRLQQQKSAPLVLLPGGGGSAAKLRPSAPGRSEQQQPQHSSARKESNNWDLYLNTGLVARKG